MPRLITLKNDPETLLLKGKLINTTTITGFDADSPTTGTSITVILWEIKYQDKLWYVKIGKSRFVNDDYPNKEYPENITYNVISKQEYLSIIQ